MGKKKYSISHLCDLLTPKYDGEEVSYQKYHKKINAEYNTKVTDHYGMHWNQIIWSIFYRIVGQYLSPTMYKKLRKLKNKSEILN